MNTAAIITSSNEEEATLALDFSSFLLRYHRDLDYADFSDDLYVQQKIKRAETYRSWADIEDLANGFETLSTNFEQHQTTAANAFQELYNHIEKIKSEQASTLQENLNEVASIKASIQQVKEASGQVYKHDVASQDNLQSLRTAMKSLVEEKFQDMEFSLNNKIITRLDAMEK